MAINVAITDDHPLAINGLQNMLQSCKHIKVTHTYTNGSELLAGLEKELPDVLLLDVLLPDVKGTDLVDAIHKKYTELKILAITSLDAPVHVKAMMRHGCKGYLLKNTDVRTLIAAIEQVHEGNEYIEPVLKEQMLNNLLRFGKKVKNKPPTLTRREKEILLLIVEEYSSQQIADKLFLSLRTIENHRFNIFQKLEVKNTIALVKLAIQMGLIS